MSVDQTLNRREAILDRLFTLGQGINEVQTSLRNPNPVPTSPKAGILGVPRPLFALFDGDARLMQALEPHKNPRMPTTIWRMDPQIMILLEQRDNFENTLMGSVENPIGPELSRWHDLLNSVIVNDPVLVDLVTVSGTHYLSSFTTSLKIGRDVGAYGAWLLMLYVFDYPLFQAR